MPKIKISLLVFLAIAILVFISYSNSLHNPFIWDDLGLIVENPGIRQLSSIPSSFSRDLYSSTVAGSNFYRPLQEVSFILDYQLWQLEPLGYRLTNILLQAIASFLVFIFVYFLTRVFTVSFFSAALFAVCPLNTEAVVYISGRSDILMAIFLMCSFILFAYSVYRRGKRRISWFVLSCLCFVLALLSKELSLVFPFVLISYLLCFRAKESLGWKAAFKVSLPFFVIDLAYLAIRFFLLDFTAIREATLTQMPFLLRLTFLPKVVFTYIRLLIAPVNLHMCRQFSYAVSRPEIFLFWLLLGFMLVLIIKSFTGKSRVSCFFLSWAIIFFIPQSGLFPINSLVAEHFIYLPSVSFFVFFAFFLNGHFRKAMAVLLLSLAVLFYGILTLSRNSQWKDPFVFYEKIIKFSPDSFQAHNNLGLEYERSLLLGSAEREYKTALKLKPDLIEASSNLANIYYKTGRLDQALAEYEKVKKLAPYGKLGEIENNIGCVYELKGNLKKALESYQLALRLSPKLNFAHFNMGKVYKLQGKIGESAISILNSLPEIKSDRENESRYLLFIGEYISSVGFGEPALFYNDLGVGFAGKGFFPAANAAFKRSIELNPASSDAYFNLGLSFWKMNDKKSAARALKKAVKINPNCLRAKSFLSEIISKK